MPPPATGPKRSRCTSGADGCSRRSSAPTRRRRPSRSTAAFSRRRPSRLRRPGGTGRRYHSPRTAVARAPARPAGGAPGRARCGALAAAAAVTATSLLLTRGGSGSAASRGLRRLGRDLPAGQRSSERADPGRGLAERGRGRRRLDLGRQRRRAQRLADRPGQAGHDPDDPGRQRPGGHRVRRRVRLGHERPRRHGLEDRPADEHGGPADPGRKRARGRGRRLALRLGRELERRHGHADRPADGEAAHGDSRSAQSADGVAVGYGSVWVTSAATGSVTRIDARTGGVSRRSMPGTAQRGAVGLHAVWVANSLDGTVTRIDPATDSVRATIPVGDGPNGIAVANGAVWVSNELGGTLSRIDPVRNIPSRLSRPETGPKGRRAPGRLFVAVRASGIGHRGGTLTVLTSSGDLHHLDPALVEPRTEWQVAALTNDGLTGFRRVGGSAGTQLVPDLAVSLPTPDRRRSVVQLPPAPGDPLLDRSARPAAGLPPRDRALYDAAGPVFYFAGIVGAQRCLAAPEKPCDLSTRDRDRSRLEHGHLPPHLAGPRLPVQARAARGVRGARRDAARSARLRACDRPVPDRLLRPEARDPARPQPEVPRVVAGSAAGRLPGRDRRALRRLGGRAHRRGLERLGRPGDGRITPSPGVLAPCGRSTRASSSSLRGTPPGSSRSTRVFRRSTASRPAEH